MTTKKILCTLGREAVEHLFERSQAEGGVAAYRKAEFDVDEDSAIPLARKIDLSKLELDGKGGSSGDVENARRLHASLIELSPQQAGDERLWTYMTHVAFPEYVWSRFEPSKATELRDYYFVRGGSSRALRRNAIARLWWAAHLTYKPWDSSPELKFLDDGNPYRLLEVLLRKQDIYQQVVEIKIGWNRTLLALILEGITRSWKSLQASSRGPIRRMLRQLNMKAAYSMEAHGDPVGVLKEIEGLLKA